MAAGMFREKALAKLSSPEQLDELMQVTRPRGWLALIAMCFLLATAVLWGIYGRIPTRVTAKGILVRPAGVFNVASNGQGPITRILVREGDMIETGQVVAEVDQIDLVAQIKEAEGEVAGLEAEHKKVVRFCEDQRKAKADYFAARTKDLNADVKEQESLVAEIQKLLAGLKILQKQGIASETEVYQVRQSLANAQSQVRSLDDQLSSIPADQTLAYHQLDEKLFESEKAMDDVKRKIQVLQTRLANTSKVTSPYTGRVLEVMVDEGVIVNVGTSVLSVEMPDKTLEAVVYVQDTEGKKVQNGMIAEITPSTVKREEYGYIIGVVQKVSDFPATPEAMMNLLHNKTLVDQLSNQGAPIEIRASLELDSHTVSGYNWSSRKGPRLKISSGTLCVGSVVVKEQPPITLVIPLLKKFFGLT